MSTYTVLRDALAKLPKVNRCRLAEHVERQTPILCGEDARARLRAGEAG